MGKITIPTPIPNPVPARNGIRPNANVFAPQIPSKEIDKNVVKAYAVDTARDVVSNGLQTAGFVVGALINERNYNEPDVYPDGYHVGTYVHPTTNMFGNDFIGAITFCPGGQTASTQPATPTSHRTPDDYEAQTAWSGRMTYRMLD